MGLRFVKGDCFRGSVFSQPDGTEEYHIAVLSGKGRDFPEELESISHSYRTSLQSFGLDGSSLAFSRLLLSDVVNQKEFLFQSKIFDTVRSGAVSIIRQCPAEGGSVALYAYHVKEKGRSFPLEKIALDSDGWKNAASVRGNNYEMFWAANLTGGGVFDARIQATGIFGGFEQLLAGRGMKIFDNTVRTWVFVRDIDNHYQGMVDARKSFFLEHSLTPDTRYIASTGIEGSSKDVNALVSVDALSFGGLASEQFVRMEALDHLSPTIRYGVTFERGMRIRFGDRSHLYISGTASIDRDGNTLHPYDIRLQTHRSIENVRALLAPHGADLRDMTYLLIYLRDIKDRNRVIEILEREIPPEIPRILVAGAVCRPSWLIEFEGVAVIPDRTDFPAFL